MLRGSTFFYISLTTYALSCSKHLNTSVVTGTTERTYSRQESFQLFCSEMCVHFTQPLASTNRKLSIDFEKLLFLFFAFLLGKVIISQLFQIARLFSHLSLIIFRTSTGLAYKKDSRQR